MPMTGIQELKVRSVVVRVADATRVVVWHEIVVRPEGRLAGRRGPDILQADAKDGLAEIGEVLDVGSSWRPAGAVVRTGGTVVESAVARGGKNLVGGVRRRAPVRHPYATAVAAGVGDHRTGSARVRLRRTGRQVARVRWVGDIGQTIRLRDNIRRVGGVVGEQPALVTHGGLVGGSPEPRDQRSIGGFAHAPGGNQQARALELVGRKEGLLRPIGIGSDLGSAVGNFGRPEGEAGGDAQSSQPPVLGVVRRFLAEIYNVQGRGIRLSVDLYYGCRDDAREVQIRLRARYGAAADKLAVDGYIAVVFQPLHARHVGLISVP